MADNPHPISIHPSAPLALPTVAVVAVVAARLVVPAVQAAAAAARGALTALSSPAACWLKSPESRSPAGVPLPWAVGECPVFRAAAVACQVPQPFPLAHRRFSNLRIPAWQHHRPSQLPGHSRHQCGARPPRRWRSSCRSSFPVDQHRPFKNDSPSSNALEGWHNCSRLATALRAQSSHPPNPTMFARPGYTISSIAESGSTQILFHKFVTSVRSVYGNSARQRRRMICG
jgi:hypothetical protein